MEDAQILELYWRRDEGAIAATGEKYGAFCHRIAQNVLSVAEDAEECVSDAYLRAWNNIPPQRPNCFQAWLGRVVRNLALNRWEREHAQKRDTGMKQLLNELEDCVPAGRTMEEELENQALSDAISRWLRTLDKQDRILFIRRYWNGDALQNLAREWKLSPAKLGQRMYRLRGSLRTALEKEGIAL